MQQTQNTQKWNITSIAVIVVVVALAAGATGWLLAKKAEESGVETQFASQPKQQDTARPDAEASSAEFGVVTCGDRTYSADVVAIGGVDDVVKRIATLRSDSENFEKCEFNIIAGHRIGVAQKQQDPTQQVITVALYDKDDERERNDPFNQSVEIYQIDLNSNTLYSESMFDGELVKLGDWK